MFRRARFRLTVLYVAMFTLVLGVFSAVFFLGFATALAPTFDLAPEISNEQAAEVAYQSAVDRIGIALLVADVVVVALVAALAWVLAARTLRPIREAHERQRRFVADASHEMRTPLTAIRASAEGALRGSGSTEQLAAALKVVASSAERLTRITNDLLLLARSDELPLRDHDPVDMSVLVAETVERLETAHPELPRVRMVLGTDLVVDADPSEVERIVSNLLDNAYRYGDAANPPTITTAASDRDVTVEVTDTGPGIAAADLERIFEPFYRVHADARAPEGSGLGLAIARGLARRNRGRLVAISQPGAATTFRLSLPRAG